MNDQDPPLTELDRQNISDVFAFVGTLTPAEALNGIGFLADHFTGPRMALAAKVHPGLTAASLMIVLATMQELAKRLVPAVGADTGATAQLLDLVDKLIQEAATDQPRRPRGKGRKW